MSHFRNSRNHAGRPKTSKAKIALLLAMLAATALAASMMFGASASSSTVTTPETAERNDSALSAAQGRGERNIVPLAESCGTVSNVTTCTENQSITIPAAGSGSPNPTAAANPFPSDITVSGVSGTINKVTVRINGLTHTSLDDLEMMLVGPNGASFHFWSESGGAAVAASNINVTLDDTAATDLPDSGGIPSGTYRPRNYVSTANGGVNDTFPAPAPAGSSAAPTGTATFANLFNGISPNGVWQLYVADDASGDVGTISGGWTLEITVGAAAAATTTTLSSSQPDFALIGQSVTLTSTSVRTSDSTPVAGGTVTFKDGGVNIAGCTNVGVNVNGQATCTTTFSTAANHNLTAEYSGNANFLPSTGSFRQVIDKATCSGVVCPANTFINNASIAVPEPGTTTGIGSPYSSHISVTGLTGTISKVTVTLNNLTHNVPDDVDILLVSPTGGTNNIILMSDVGGNTPASNVTLTFDDAAAGTIPDAGPLASGTFRPSNSAGTGTETFPAPAPTPSSSISSHTTLGAAFNGTNPNGVWRLYVVDDASGDTGQIAGGWGLTFTLSSDVPTTTTLTSSQPNFATTGTPVTFTATVTRSDNSNPVTVGTVLFKDGGVNLTCSEGAQPRPLNGSGQATCTTSSLSVGNHTITADYSGVPGQFNLSSATFVQVVDSPTTQTGNEFCNNGGITIPAAGQGPISGATGSPYPSHVTVAGFTGNLSNLTVELNSLTHTNPDDLDFLLVSPTGQNIVLMSDVGGTADVSNVSLTFDDAAAGTIPDAGPLVSGTFKPSNSGGGDPFPAPAPAPSGATTLAGAFNGNTPNGVWRLYAVDDAGGDVGSLGGWCLNVTVPPGISVNDATAAEPASGSTNMVFTVVLSAPAPPAGVSVNFTTADEPAGPGKAVAGSDYTATNGTINFTSGQQVKTINVPVLADGDGSEPNETFLVNLSAPVGAVIVDGQAVGTITPPGTGAGGAPGTVLISELRTSGPNGAGDDFVEIYNNSGSPVTVGPTAWALVATNNGCTGDPVIVGLIPNGTSIPARGHYLFVGSTYSLGGYAAGDATLTANLNDDVNVALFSVASLTSLSSTNRLDAVGFGLNTGGVCDLAREGTTLGAANGSTSQYSFVRKLTLVSNDVPTPTDTNDNASDFHIVSTTPATAVGTHASPKLGAPGPENFPGPRLKTFTQVGAQQLDPAVSSSAAPNRVRTGSGNSGTLSMRRTFTNNTGAAITALRFRFYDISAGPAPVGTADLRVATSADTTATVTGVGTVTVRGTILQTPPAQPNGGGLNSSVTPTADVPLANGASINVQFLFNIQQSGTFRVFVIVEALP